MKKIMLIVLMCVFIGSGLMLAGSLLEYKQGQDLYEAAAEQIVIPPPKPEPGEVPSNEERGPVPPAIDFEMLASISPIQWGGSGFPIRISVIPWSRAGTTSFT